MSCSKITLIGLYNYDPTIFDNLTFPAGIVKEVAINEILLKSGEFEIVYPDTEFLKSMIEHWGKKCYRTFEKWIEALSIEFNPLYNYDRYEEYTDSRSKADSRDITDSRNTSNTRNASDIRSHADSNTKNDNRENVGNAATIAATTSTTNEDTTETKSVSAYDSNTYQPKEQDILDRDITTASQDNSMTSNKTSESGSASEHNTGNESGQSSENTTGLESGTTNETGSENELSKHDAHLYGNIGVTTSTQMLEDFLRVERFNIYEQIADIFITEFCVLVYE